MVIRRPQFESFRSYMRGQFADRMVQHLRANFPDQTSALVDPGLRDVILRGIDAAEGYGVRFEGDIQRYLEYMMVLSWDFDQNPKTSWAGDILRNRNIDGAEKINRIDNVYLYSRKGKA